MQFSVCVCIYVLCVCIYVHEGDCVWGGMCIIQAHVHSPLSSICVCPCVSRNLLARVSGCTMRVCLCLCVSVCEGCEPAPGDSLQRGIKAISCHRSSLWPLKLPHSGSPICYLATGPS